ncbi:rhodanese-like domain-containing protein [Parvibium lacunae]|uniref:Rhodanese-like domain-containing protein n=1 Tax=Parvibium lacunae TaxID=1888893 RepID=A0A368L7Q2_9BURK|nr:rhodanese-like domain-containing protein [Parvibium lacunae]RCS59695.1 rhodanese-like domain-containing protein [Parvibium lacunae]
MNPQTIQAKAQERAISSQLPYAGAITPEEAAAWLAQDPHVILVDVRTRAEWQWVGQPQITAAQYRQIEWNLASTGSRNPHFQEELTTAVPPTNAMPTLLFLCRSGARSHAAAELAQRLGYPSHNILSGFEGDKNTLGQRKSVNGWCAAGLPWIQS